MTTYRPTDYWKPTELLAPLCSVCAGITAGVTPGLTRVLARNEIVRHYHPGAQARPFGWLHAFGLLAASRPEVEPRATELRCDCGAVESAHLFPVAVASRVERAYALAEWLTALADEFAEQAERDGSTLGLLDDRATADLLAFLGFLGEQVTDALAPVL